MNFLSREKQIEIIAALCEGVGQRAVTRLTGTDRKTVARLALRVAERLARSRYRSARDFNGWLSSLPLGDPRHVRRQRLAWRHCKDL
jgi:hypothetical protein